MFKKSSYLFVILALITVNAFGVLLRLYDMPDFIILLGFRFHISLIIPFLFIVSSVRAERVKKEFTDPFFKKNFPFVISLFLLPVLAFTVLYIVDYIILGDPEYFFEFGLSSIVDLPIYLAWNSIQLMAFYFFLIYAAESTRFRIPAVYFAVILPFAYEFYPLNNFSLVPEIAAITVIGIAVTIIILKFRNIYWFIIFMFLFMWQYILLFGSHSDILIKMIFAARYSSWEGFFERNKIIADYSLPVYVFSVTFILSLFAIFIKKEKSSET